MAKPNALTIFTDFEQGSAEFRDKIGLDDRMAIVRSIEAPNESTFALDGKTQVRLSN